MADITQLPPPQDSTALDMVDALMGAMEEITTDTPRNSGLFVCQVDEYGRASLMACANLHAGEIIAACAVLTHQLAADLQGDSDYE